MTIDRVPPLFISVLLIAATGCSSQTVTATATVQADGSFQRTLVYTGDFSDQDKTTVHAVPATVVGSDLKGYFSPPRGAAWTLTAREDSARNRQIIATRRVALDEPVVRDLGVLTPDVPYAAIRIANVAKVTRIAPNRLQYREVIRWVGPLPFLLRQADPAYRQGIQKALPPSLAYNGPAVDRITLRIQRGLCQLLIPNASPFMTPEFTNKTEEEQERGFCQLIRPFAADALVREEGANGRTHAVSVQIAAAFGKAFLQKIQETNTVDPSPYPFVHLIFHVAMPGRIIATDGTLDAGKRQVEWSIPPEAAALGDVTLTATSETTPPSAIRPSRH